MFVAKVADGWGAGVAHVQLWLVLLMTLTSLVRTL